MSCLGVMLNRTHTVGFELVRQNFLKAEKTKWEVM